MFGAYCGHREHYILVLASTRLKFIVDYHKEDVYSLDLGVCVNYRHLKRWWLCIFLGNLEIAQKEFYEYDIQLISS